jgi:outer membrane beta-barrel protein
MKKILKGILPGLLLVTLATPGFAENREGAYTLSPFVGGYYLDHEQREENRPIFGLRGGYNITKNFGAEAMFGYSLTETKEQYGSRETDLYRYGFEFLYHFMPESNLVPFLALGGGATHFNTADTPSADRHYSGLFDYGVGVKYFVAEDVALRGDVRHVVLVHDLGENNLEYSVGLTFQMGGTKKAVMAAAAVAEPAREAADTTAPAVTFTAPINGATAIPVNQKAYVAFNEEMDPATLTGESFTVKQGETSLSGRVTTTGANTIFTPSGNLEKDKTYTGTITTKARDKAGNALANNYVWSFSTGPAADTTPPTVTFTSPVNGATAAPVNQKVNAAFSENMDPTSITAKTFTLKQGNTPVPGKVTAGASTATFTPDRKLEKSKGYTATVTTGTTDLAGNPLAKDYVFNFTAFSTPVVVGVLTTLENSHFDFNSVAISENGKTILNHNITLLKKDPKIIIRVAGYTSASGTEAYNQALSERRAASVKDYLVNGGIDESRISTIGYGEKNPAKYEADPSDRLSPEALANMRVVVEIIEEQ